MGYDKALEQAWEGAPREIKNNRFSIRLLSDTYDIDIDKKTIISRSCNAPAKEHISIIILHYLARKSKLKTLPDPSGEWIDFKDLEGGEGYYPAFRKRTIDRLVKKFGSSPELLIKAVERIPHKKTGQGDAGIIVEALEGVGVSISVWGPDDEFGPSANILFDRTISDIFCTEDIVVLTEIITHSI